MPHSPQGYCIPVTGHRHDLAGVWCDFDNINPMKIFLLFTFLLSTISSFEQPIDYCDYFTLKLNERENGSRKSIFYHIEKRINGKTDFDRFLKSHDIRFKYLLLNYSDQLQNIKQLYPDTALIATRFCHEIIKSDSVQRYFRALTPSKLTRWDLRHDYFTTKEMMEVASRFFYCTGVNERDTTINYKICIGINGQRESFTGKDFLLLKAFAIEAILFHMSKRKNPVFFTDFEYFLKIQTVVKRKEFKDYDSYLHEIRQICYFEMQGNADLKKKLLDYYESNRNNLNFGLE